MSNKVEEAFVRRIVSLFNISLFLRLNDDFVVFVLFRRDIGGDE